MPRPVLASRTLFVVAAFFAAAAVAQPAQSSASQPGVPISPPRAGRMSHFPPNPAEKILPDVRFDEATLPQVFDFLRQADPTFQVLLSYDPGVDAGAPTITDLKLHNVTASQVLEALVSAYPQLRVDRTGERGDQAIWTVRVSGMFPQRSDLEPTTTVLSLRDVVARMMRDDVSIKSPKDAQHAVLSAIELALRTDDTRTNPQLLLHEPTETLIFRGTRAQAKLVQETLNALYPPYVMTLSPAEYNRFKQRISELERRVFGAAAEEPGTTTQPARKADAHETPPATPSPDKSQATEAPSRNPGK